MSDKQKQYPLQPYSNGWEIAANEIRKQFAPRIYDCQHCGAPVAKGYCCTYCGSATPRHSDGD